MRESRPYGSVRGDRGNPVPYRDHVSVATLYRHVGKRGAGDGGPDAPAHG